ncbi:FCD domain-containing protein [Mycobacterium sp. 663a-19]|uniref:FadR/GntR family transcriptional regulator n=1 Tax=Mycobacterium sp. 663a-19 TaxID=2986148 RepID=UPI002D1F1959|nr:FCD domain-containing protein [Mycobacterium sp. 663a-19]MEB3980092.1 FCD domain-containing protein [Mycobacterium sp. 663a-19]
MGAEEREYGQVEAPALRRSEWDAAISKRPATTRSELAAQAIAASIKRVGPGGRLGTKEELRLQCGVSVGTLNEAIRLLQARGLVTVRPGPGGGLFACDPPPMVRLGNVMLALDSRRTSVTDAVRIRRALDALLIEDAIWHANAADIGVLKARLADMAAAAETGDGIAFLHANCALHAQIAAVSPNAMLSSIYVGLLDVIEAHTLAVVPAAGEPLPESLLQRYHLHARLVDAIVVQDPAGALDALAQHNATID